MSGTAYPGAVGTLTQTTAGLLTGRTRGMIPFKQWTQGGGGSMPAWPPQSLPLGL